MSQAGGTTTGTASITLNWGGSVVGIRQAPARTSISMQRTILRMPGTLRVCRQILRPAQGDVYVTTLILSTKGYDGIQSSFSLIQVGRGIALM